MSDNIPFRPMQNTINTTVTNLTTRLTLLGNAQLNPQVRCLVMNSASLTAAVYVNFGTSVVNASITQDIPIMNQAAAPTVITIPSNATHVAAIGDLNTSGIRIHVTQGIGRGF